MPRPSSPPEGKSGERRRARPISTLHVLSEVIVGRISPAAVSIENSSASVQPWRRRYRIASRAPLPDSSASEPSGLKIRSARHERAGSLGGEISSTPSEWAPKCAAQIRRTRSGRELEREIVALDDDVVVAERLPFLEPHGRGSLVAGNAEPPLPRLSRVVRSITSTPASLLIQVSWRFT